MRTKLGFITCVLLLLRLSAAVAGADQEVVVGGGKSDLHGSLRLPGKEARTGPAVLLIAGSGPTDRDGNSKAPGVKPNMLKLIADALDAGGVPSLRFDKRGIGASAGALSSEADLTLATEVSDVVAWAGYLKKVQNVSCVVLLGHSQGALLAVLAANEVRACGVVSISGAGRPLGDIMKEQVAAAPRVSPEMAHEFAADIDLLLAGKNVPNVPPPFMALLRPSVQPYLMSWLPVDPAVAISKVTAPLLIIQGDNDIQVKTEDATRLSKGNPLARLLVVAGVNHVLKRAPADRAGNIATYADPTLPVDPRIIDAIAEFVRSARPR